MAFGSCIVCDWCPVWARDRCQTCLRFYYRHGYDRPETLIVSHGELVVQGRGRRHTLETRARISASKRSS